MCIFKSIRLRIVIGLPRNWTMNELHSFETIDKSCLHCFPSLRVWVSSSSHCTRAVKATPDLPSLVIIALCQFHLLIFVFGWYWNLIHTGSDSSGTRASSSTFEFPPHRTHGLGTSLLCQDQQHRIAIALIHGGQDKQPSRIQNRLAFRNLFINDFFDITCHRNLVASLCAERNSATGYSYSTIHQGSMDAPLDILRFIYITWQQSMD